MALWAMRGALLAVMGILLGWSLLTRPIIAVANNGDFARLMSPSGFSYAFDPVDPAINPNFFRFVTRVVLVSERQPSGYWSSAQLPIEMARMGHRITADHPFFDVRRLGVAYLFLHLLAYALFLLSISGLSMRTQGVAGGAWLFLFSDIGYWSYFNTFYAEAGTVVFGLLWLGTLGFLARPDAGTRGLGLATLLHGGAALLFLVAKPQNAVLAPVVIALWFLLARPWSRGRSSWAMGMALAVVLAACSAAYFLSRPYKEVNLFNHVFVTISYLEEDPAAALEVAGLDPAFAPLTGWGAWWNVAPENEALRQRFVEEANLGHVLRFYAARPDRFLDLMAASAAEAFVFRPPFYGNMEQESGAADWEQSARLSHLSWMKERVYPRTLAGMAAFFLVLLVLGVAGLRGGSRPLEVLSVVALALWGAAALQYMAVLVGEGTFDLVRHLFLFNFLVDALVLVVATGIAVAGERVSGRSR